MAETNEFNVEDQLNFEAEKGQSSKKEVDEESADDEDEEKEDFEPVDDEDEQSEEEVKEFQPLPNGRVQVRSLLIELI